MEGTSWRLMIAALGLVAVAALGNLALGQVKAWAGAARENVTYRALARANAAELERREALLSAARGREADFARREAARRATDVETDCEIPDALWDLLP